MALSQILFVVLSLLQFGLGGNVPSVEIPQGKLVGTYMKSRDGLTYSAFMGIPYADKPELFEVAKPAQGWSGVRDASKFGSICLQFPLGKTTLEGDEDCLFVNVFTPNVTGNYPVMVFIHGGGFQFGNSDENGADYFMDEPVVLVTLNYRVSALGFLSTGDENLPGNFGLKDQLLALKWVQQNIKFFGGNIQKVTLFGESAGAASVSHHILSPASEGLFHNAILQSGSALCNWAVTEDPKKVAFDLAKRVNCPTESTPELKTCLKSKSAQHILSHAIRPSVLFDPLQNLVVYAPAIEPEGPDAFLTEHPQTLYESGRFKKVPMLVSVCEKEGLLVNAGAILINDHITKEFNDNWLQKAPATFLYNHPKISKEAKDIVSKKIQKFYFQGKVISHETLDNLTNVFSDVYFFYGSRNAALFHAKHAPVYAIILAYDGMPWSHIMNMGFEKPMGMTHADDLPVGFSADKYPKFERGSEAELASKYFVKAWASFATNSDPNFHEAFKSWKPVSEKEIRERELKWLYVKSLKEVPKQTAKPASKRMEFWDKMYKKFNAEIERSKKDEL